MEVIDPPEGGLDPFQETEFNILFIGNSLTYFNNLPDLVKEVAARDGKDLGVKMIAQPNYAIVDHWDIGQVQQEIRTGKYDFVVIQQGPSSQQDGRQMLIEEGAKYASIFHEYNVRLAYFMVWPSITYYHTFDGVIENYTDAAKLNTAILCPVGKEWKLYIDSSGDYSYYGPDGFHPSRKGSEVAAEIIYGSIMSVN